MSLKRPRPFQTKLFHTTHFQSCPKCHQPIFKRVFEVHLEDCGRGMASPARSIPETDCSDSEWELRTAIDVIMETEQVTLRENFHLEYLGVENGRHQWRWCFQPTESPTWTSSPKYLRVNPNDPSCIALTLSTNLSPGSFDLKDVSPLPGFPRAMLLSILQKNVRRQRRVPTIHTSMQIAANLGFVELARRLCIINLEETVLHPDYPVAAWCFSACRQFPPPQCLFETILQLAADIATIPVRDSIDFGGSEDCFALWRDSSAIPRTILMRGFYRGMKGDVRMMAGYARIWERRLSADRTMGEKLKSLYYRLPTVADREKGAMKFADVPPAAIDNGVSSAVTPHSASSAYGQ